MFKPIHYDWPDGYFSKFNELRWRFYTVGGLLGFKKTLNCPGYHISLVISELNKEIA